MLLGDLVAGRSGNVTIEHGDVVAVHAQQLQRECRRRRRVGRDRLQPQAVADGLGQERLVLDDQYAHAPMVGSRAYRRRIENRIRAGNARLPSTGWHASPPASTPPAHRPHRRARRPARRRAARVRPAHRRGGSTPLRHDVAIRRNVPGEPPGRLQSRALGVADGEVADGTTVLADVPAVTKLDSALLAALRLAAADASAMGVELDVNSGWRSYGYQESSSTRPSRARFAGAGRAMGRPPRNLRARSRGRGRHRPLLGNDVAGQARAGFGLCQVYDNEPWHYELHLDAVDQGCPATYADPTHDPRMRP